jgi:uncharacterized protein YecE (DUF72 family)
MTTPATLPHMSEFDTRVTYEIRIGCAGWSLPRDQRQFFRESGSTLERYASGLRAAEINSSFYRPHLAKTYASWAESVPESFRFSVKVPKTISHEHDLLGTGPLIDKFLGECLALGDKLGGLLVQLPPRLAFDARRSNAFFGLLRRRVPAGIHIACEPRHPSWFGSDAVRIFSRHHVNRVAADPAQPTWRDADLPTDSGDWRYWRLHGSPRRYYSAYSKDFLIRLAGALNVAVQTSDVWVIFDNTAQGHAVADAIGLQRLLAAGAAYQKHRLPPED